MALDPGNLPHPAREFLVDRHIGTLTLVTPDGRPHVTPVGFTWDDQAGVGRVITWTGSRKTRLLAANPDGLRAAFCQVEKARWITLEGWATVSADPAENDEAIRRYAERYRQPKDRGPDRRTVRIAVDRVIGSSAVSAV